MTDEEANAWDEHFTKSPPDVGAGKNRTRLRRLRMVEVGDVSANYILGKRKKRPAVLTTGRFRLKQ
jgi:hypothetical protein